MSSEEGKEDVPTDVPMLSKIEFIKQYKQVDPEASREEVAVAWKEELERQEKERQEKERERQEKERERQFELEKLRLQSGENSNGTPSVVADLTQLLKEASISRPQPQSLNAMLRDNYPLLQEYVKLKDVTAVVEMYTSYKEMVRLSTKAVCAQKKLNIGARLGTMFSVYSGSQNGSPVIIKKVSAASMEFQMAALFRDHDSIVQIDNSIVHNDSAMLVMSKYPCSLFDAVVTDGDLLFTGVISMVEALNHVHSKGVVHMDVKPHNIFVTQSGVWLLGDFGSATFEGEKISTTTSTLLLEPVTSGSTSAAYKFDWQMLVVGILHMVQASQVQDGVSITPLLCEEEKYHASKVKCLELLRAFPHSRLQQLLCQLLSCQMQTFDRDFAEEEEDKDSSSSSSSSSSPQ